MDIRRLKFLVIDDQIENLTILNALLKETYQSSIIMTALNGEAGIEIASKNEPDIIFLDIFMPNIDGYEICRRFKSNNNFKDIPIIFVTAMTRSKESRMQALRCGGDAFISKPIDEIELIAQVETMLKIKEANEMKSDEKKKLKYLISEKTDELFDLKEKHRRILDDLPALVSEFLPDSTLTYVNKAYSDYYNLSREELIGKKFLDIIPLDEREFVHKRYSSIVPDYPMRRFSYSTNIAKKESWQELRVRGIFDENDILKHYYSIGLDITERKLAENKLIFLSYHDYLTGLYNRKFFSEEMKRLNTIQNLPISIIMADINGLKLINDSFGHLMGDVLLVEASKAIVDGCRDFDIVARIGGDEFAIILPKTDSIHAQKVVKAIMENIGIDTDKNSLLSLSLGVATKDNMQEDISELFASAENSMYKKKIYESSSVKNQTVNVIMNSLFEKSERELEHSKRVSEFCFMIANHLGFDQNEVNKIKTAGLLHDIGKISIDEKILNKSDKLSHEEWVEMKKHSESGWRILSSVKEFSEIAECIVSHHEMWDGKGYPNGLKGKEIPIESRIISIADAFDAMTSTRTYRKGMSQKQAIDELRKFSGIQFDHEIVDVFIKLMKDEIN